MKMPNLERIWCLRESTSPRRVIPLVFSTNPPFVRVLCLRHGWRCEPCPECPAESHSSCVRSLRVQQPSSERPRPYCLLLQRNNRDLCHRISELLPCWSPLQR